jgi:hypothetical protein
MAFERKTEKLIRDLIVSNEGQEGKRTVAVLEQMSKEIAELQAQVKALKK